MYFDLYQLAATAKAYRVISKKGEGGAEVSYYYLRRGSAFQKNQSKLQLERSLQQTATDGYKPL